MSLIGNINEDVPEAGCDEAGRGCLAGPVFAAAVILPSHFQHPLLDDSKKLDASTRSELRTYIETHAIAWAVARCEAAEIDELNILRASIRAMHRALELLKLKPGHIIVDGNRFNSWHNVPFRCYVKGDGRFKSIAAASILAKTHRDEYMDSIHGEYPVYGWDRNKGYPTEEHRLALQNSGLSPHHRRSFRLLPDQLSLEL